MTQEEKQLLLTDLCGRLPNEVKGLHRGEIQRLLIMDSFGSYQVNGYGAWFDLKTVPFKPYLRPMSSMTKEERLELSRLTDDKFKFYLYTTKPEIICYEKYNYLKGLKVLDWLNAHHFDYRGLIDKGLALEAPSDMYKTE